MIRQSLLVSEEAKPPPHQCWYVKVTETSTLLRGKGATGPKHFFLTFKNVLME